MDGISAGVRPHVDAAAEMLRPHLDAASALLQPHVRAASDLVRPHMDALMQWRFVPDVTPYSGWLEPWLAVAVYFVVIRGLQAWRKGKKPLKFPAILFLHNILLSIGSALLFAALAYVLFEKAFMDGYSLHNMICSEQMHDDGRLHMIYYINYFFKYYELLDTVFLVLQSKEVLFLHSYHHAATLILTWSQQREHSTVQWVPILLNLFVHILMYYYYAMTTIKKGAKIWWKKYLTSIQISQFVIDVIACAYAYTIFIVKGFNYEACYGTQTGAITGILILGSYLLLFIQFYQNTYKKSSPKKSD
ncbi:putative elongation of fatty acids protein 1 [Porphyridium purpureum]|uniref:Elongation of fatty acids protein n=1 Tax=Porphyridium purpureum TaxID=35688 RepID=A0A5J4YNW5_PORPP|nr:putative elongation of fatty acids protein 1 [Porphyridium purpureum]|eukprot:POR0770..scf296_7